jgi:uncharacterized SAM-binding protein YcdF (DUF218 family)
VTETANASRAPGANVLDVLDVVVVLGCRVYEGGQPSAAARRRAREAARTFHRTFAKAVVASGGRRWEGVAEADALALLLVEYGVPKKAIVRELCSLSTIENAAYSAELLQAAELSRVGVVTCDWHLDRALACFEAVGVQARGFPALAPLTVVSRSAKHVLETARTWIDRRISSHWTRP